MSLSTPREGASRGARSEELASAIELHRGGEIARAWAIYERILKEDPDDVTAVHFGGLLAYHHGDRTLGRAMIGHALALDPGYVDARNNLGNILKLEGRLGEAAAQYRHVLERVPSMTEPMINLGVLARVRGAYDEAEAWYRRAIEHDPDDPVVWTNLSGLLDRQGRAAEALDALQTAIGKRAGDGPAEEHLHIRRANILLRLGRGDEAAAIYRGMLDADPANETALHMLAALTGESLPERPGEGYVRTLFDRFAESFDEVLDNLDYKAPTLVGETVARHHADGAALRVLDAGCGTGLCGRFLRPVAASLSGIDLSAGMLARAGITGHYDALVEAEMIRFLRDVDEPYDLIVSADTFCYFGALEELLDASAGALAPGGRLIFTVEAIDGDAGRGYVLHPHGRYAHERDYVVACLEQVGLVAESIEERVLRKERGEPVTGLLVDSRRASRSAG